MIQKENSTPDTLLYKAALYVHHPRMQEAFRYGILHPGVFEGQLKQLDHAIREINTTRDQDIPHDMKNTHTLKELVRTSGRSLPLVLEAGTQSDPKLRRLYRQTLRVSAGLIGSYFSFPLKIRNLEQRLGAGALDLYSFLVPYMWGQSGKDAKDGQGLVVNALCEVLAETHVKNSERPSSLFRMARKNEWFKKSYGFGEGFLARHNLPTE